MLELQPFIFLLSFFPLCSNTILKKKNNNFGLSFQRNKSSFNKNIMNVVIHSERQIWCERTILSQIHSIVLEINWAYLFISTFLSSFLSNALKFLYIFFCIVHSICDIYKSTFETNFGSFEIVNSMLSLRHLLPKVYQWKCQKFS